MRDLSRRVLVVGCNSWTNKGDAALLLALDAGLRSRLPGIELTYCTKTPALDRRRLGVRAVAQPVGTSRGGFVGGIVRMSGQRWAHLASGVVSAESLVREARAIAVRRAGARPGLGGTIGRRLLPGSLRPLDRLVMGHDVVVGAPGGYLLAADPADVTWQAMAAPFWFAPRAGRPVLLAPCTIGPFPRLQQQVANHALRDAELVLLRERDSLPWVLRSGIDPARVEVVADLAWLVPAEPAPAAVADALADGPAVGFAVRDVRFAGAARPASARASYVLALARAADALAEAHARTVFFPQVENPDHPDSRFGSEVKQHMRHPERAVVLTDDLTPGQLRDAYGRLAVLIATRMHAGILAMSAGTPVVAIAIGHKTTGIMRALGREDDALAISSLTAESLTARVCARREAGPDGRAALARAVDASRAEAERGLDLLAQHIARSPSIS